MWWNAVSYNKLQQTHNVYGVLKWTLYCIFHFENESNVWYRHIYSNIGTGTVVVYARMPDTKKTLILYNKYNEHIL
jgi:hypothetical protein